MSFLDEDRRKYMAEDKITNPKKIIILRMLEILTKYSDADHKLKHSEILRILDKDYGIICERKAIARNLKLLDDAGYEIGFEESGVYLISRRFDPSEIRYMIDSIIFNRYIPSNHAEQLIDKLKLEGGISLKNHPTNICSFENENISNQSYFSNIDMLTQAIEKGVKVELHYLSYRIDKKLYNKSNDKNLVNPYYLLFKNGTYYLMCNYDKYNSIVFCKVHKISDLRILENQKIKELSQIPGFETKVDITNLSSKLPYLFYSKPEEIVFVAESYLIDEIIERFGLNNVSFIENNDKRIKVTLEASPEAIHYWILQFGPKITLVSPLSLVEKIKEDIEKMKKNYGF